MTTVHLLRHGETIWHAENRYAGWTDVALTDRGREQAEGLVGWARAAELEVVASSDLSRAVDTAAPIVRATGLPHVVDPGWREAGFGQGEGLTRTEMAGRFPDALDAFLAAPATSPLPDGEPGTVAAERAVAALVRLIAPRPEGCVAVVAHSTLIRLLLCRLLGLPLDEYRRRFPVMTNASVTTVRLSPVVRADEVDGRGALLGFNVPAG